MRAWLAFAAATVAATGVVAWLLLRSAEADGAQPPLVMTLGLSLFLGFCAAVVGALVVMVARGLTTARPAVELAPDEQVLGSLAANHWRGVEARGGRLFVTGRGLHFTPHRFNGSLRTVSVAWDDVVTVRAFGRSESGQVAVETATGAEVFVVPWPEQTREQLLRVGEAPIEVRAEVAAGFPWRREDPDRRSLTA